MITELLYEFYEKITISDVCDILLIGNDERSNEAYRKAVSDGVAKCSGLV